MTISVVHGSIRRDGDSRRVADAVVDAARASTDADAQLVGLAPFREMFDGDYVTDEAATPAQREVVERMKSTEAHLYVVPTYFKGYPAILKNFLDIVRVSDVFSGKLIAVIASSVKNQDHGARQALQVLGGILEFSEASTVILPEVTVIDPDHIQADRIETLLRRLEEYYRLTFLASSIS